MSNVVICIDGGFLEARFKFLTKREKLYSQMTEAVITSIMEEVRTLHPGNDRATLFRVLYYDCEPYKGIRDNPGRVNSSFDFSKTIQFEHKTSYLKSLRLVSQLSLRLGDLAFRGWTSRNDGRKDTPVFVQKGVDIKLAMDVTLMVGRRNIHSLVIVTGDADFVPVLKHARREGMLVYLHTLGQKRIKHALIEHCDFALKGEVFAKWKSK